jgi:hypothetical protein
MVGERRERMASGLKKKWMASGKEADAGDTRERGSAQGIEERRERDGRDRREGGSGTRRDEVRCEPEVDDALDRLGWEKKMREKGVDGRIKVGREQRRRLEWSNGERTARPRRSRRSTEWPRKEGREEAVDGLF